MDKSKRFRKQILRIIMTVNSHHTGAYAAQAAYFFVLSLIPILLLLVFMAVRYTPLNQDDVLNAVLQVFPTSVSDLMRGIVYQVYRQSESVIPVTIIVALWAAGRGVLSVTSGLNAIYSNIETRNYFYLRIRSTIYTLLFLIAIILSLVISVFGNSISVIVYEHIPFLSRVVDFIMRIRTLVTLVILTVFWDMVYRFLPNRRHKAKTTFRKQLPGAAFTACGWLLISFVFSIYLDIFTGFSDMYGSMTTLILILLWLYGCMYIILLGGEINALLDRYVWRAKSGVDKQETCDKMEE
ncbi:MAG TPA: YihY/virulence factor BrkB family protein [Candidatus Mediterraneibacter excrementavium]|nr:YihY/virulence factor BrkB family protein [Candidatus Mediterraneibacter excrementavium]